MREIVYFVRPIGINDRAISSGSVLHVMAVCNCTMIALFMSLVTSSSKGLDNLRPRAAPLGFCEVL